MNEQRAQASEHPGYSSADRERFMDEPAKRAGRTEFARDRARIIHSFALRRLAAKTQVAVPWERDFPRTRLSHSLECAQVGRELGGALGADPDLMEGACLAHDIGHPPFGHNGEEILNELAQSCGGFEGNAQSLRLLVRLEAKSVDAAGRSLGLNLTRASLDAAAKYPWPRVEGMQKFGVYDDDLEIFRWMRTGIEPGKVCLEAQIMDWSDDIAYSVHDLEDAIVSEQLKIDGLYADLDNLYNEAKQNYLADITEEEAKRALDNLHNLSCWPAEYNGSHADLARLKDLTSQLVGRFALAAEQATRAEFGAGDLTRYAANLIIPREQHVEVSMLKAMAGFYIINAASSQKRYSDQHILIRELVEALLESAPRSLETFFVHDWEMAENDSARLRVVIDQVASLTDPGANVLHAKLTSRSR